MKYYNILLIGVILAAGLVACSVSREPIHLRIEVGQTKQEIIDAVGEPDSKENIFKNVEYIFGPEEEFWDKIPMGAELEVWGYDDEGGHLNLYFVDGSDRLDYKAFAPEGVVY